MPAVLTPHLDDFATDSGRKIFCDFFCLLALSAASTKHFKIETSCKTDQVLTGHCLACLSYA